MSGSSSAANSANSSNSSNPTHSIGGLAAGFDVIVEGEGWRGLAAAKQLDEISPGVVLISLPAHARKQLRANQRRLQSRR